MPKGYLVLENGSVFSGDLWGPAQTNAGEVVFNTSMVGYEQIITDPSYAGQIIVMTYPLIGNYGVCSDNLESDQPWLCGFVVRELCPESGCQHYEQEMYLQEYLDKHNLSCLSGIDTRAVTREIRSRGTMGGVITGSLDNMDQLMRKARSGMTAPPEGYVMQVTGKQFTRLGCGVKRIVLMDFGVKKNIIRSLLYRECEVIVVPANTGADKIMALNPNGIVLSNGPGDPQDCPYAIKTIADLIGKLPVFGICLGHQLAALAIGANTYKLTFGHRGGNHPVKEINSGRVYITSQNHGYAVDENSLKHTGARVAFKNLNDGTIEGLFHPQLDLMTVQFHPEAAPGPYDTKYLIDEFLAMTA